MPPRNITYQEKKEDREGNDERLSRKKAVDPPEWQGKIKDSLKQPFVIVPGFAGHRAGKDVFDRDKALLNNDLSRF